MSSDASTFISGRKNATSITDNRIRKILWYVLECHRIFISENKTYSQMWVQKKTTLHFEDYLKFEFLDNYLIPNKKLLNDKLSNLDEINFAAETQKRYIDTDGKQKPDKIDICINKLGLQREWNESDENIYFVIECKRIKKLTDTKDYIFDIEKFCNRNYINLRLPFEGQIAFVENSKLSASQIVNEIDNRLAASTTIATNQFLSNIKIHEYIDSSYHSKHIRSFNNRWAFSIYHLLLDYSKVVVD
jgi:hypothetical protein